VFVSGSRCNIRAWNAPGGTLRANARRGFSGAAAFRLNAVTSKARRAMVMYFMFVNGEFRSDFMGVGSMVVLIFSEFIKLRDVKSTE
jgi:hypothetical protein